MLKTRILTALLLLVVFLCALLYLPAPAWALLCAALTGIGAWEWGQFARLTSRGARAAFVAVCVVLALLATFAPLERLGGWIPSGAANGAYVLALLALNLLLWLVCIPLILRRRAPLPQGVTLAVGIIVLVPTAIALAFLRNIDWKLLLACMAIAWVADTAAFFAGRRFGKVKLAPAVSPGKTREGALGALLAVVLYGLLLAAAFQERLALTPAGWLLLVALLVVLTIFSILGDLLESWFKRQVGLKDSGTLLPGHGGLLYLIDSLTAILPPTTILMCLVVWLAQD
ncbi:MAG: phosphatidate cytidylyltransferase [Rhodocyclaceae bacterium]|nr:phosphatidate cytidylyltransferase [Rhodocyclaceae bacterium]